jgi:hypothetical protein
MPVSYAAIFPDLVGAAPRAIVLHAAIDVVRYFHIDVDVIELSQWKVFNEPPRLPAIVADCDASIVAVDYQVAVKRMDPECVMIRVYTVARRDVRELFASIGAHGKICLQTVESILVLGIDANIGEVEGALVDVPALVDHLP